MGMAKVWLTVIVVGWLVFAVGLTGFGGTQTGDWEYALGTGIKRIGYLLGGKRPAAPADCVHRVRVETPVESFTLLAFSIGEADPVAAAKAMQEQYEELGGIYKDHLVIEQGGVQRRIEGHATRRWGNWLYIEVIDKRS